MRWLSLVLALCLTSPVWANEDYTQSVASVNLNQLTRELRAAGLPTLGCSRSGTQLTVHVQGTLTEAQRAQLQSVIAAHLPVAEPASQADWRTRYQNAQGAAKVDVLADYLGLR